MRALTDRVGFAIVGPGKAAHIHARAIGTIPGARLAAVCGRDMGRTSVFARTYGEARPYTDLDALLNDPDVDAVSICTPHPQHEEEAVRAAQAGRHVIVEKPMAVTLEACDRMIAAAAAARVRLGVVSQRRFYEPVQRVKQAIEAGKIGAPILGVLEVFSWRGPEYYAMDPWRGKWQEEGGGVLVNQTSHQLDLFQWLMGPAEALFGYWDNLNHPYIEVDDTALAVIRFKSGALGNIIVSNSQNPGLWGKIHVFGANGAAVGVQTDGGAMFVAGMTTKVDPPMNDLWTVPGEEHLLAQWQAEDRTRADQVDIMQHYHRLQLADFVEAIRDDRPPTVTGEDGRAAVELFTAIYRSQETGLPVRFPL